MEGHFRSLLSATRILDLATQHQPLMLPPSVKSISVEVRDLGGYFFNKSSRRNESYEFIIMQFRLRLGPARRPLPCAAAYLICQ
jgi:hypothetical protein